MDKVETIVIGGGVVGLAIAARIAADGDGVLLLEKGNEIGMGISSRNSEVIHAGIYYAPESLKARLCVAGNRMLYQYCSKRNIPHRRVGKLIVANGEADESQLEAIRNRALESGVTDLQHTSAKQISELEPAVKAAAGLLSPSTGIVSAHDFMNSLAGDVTNRGGQIAVRAEVEAIARGASGFEITCRIEGEAYQIAADRIIN